MEIIAPLESSVPETMTNKTVRITWFALQDLQSHYLVQTEALPMTTELLAWFVLTVNSA